MPSCQISGYLPTYLRARSGLRISTTFPLDISNEYSRDQTVRQISYYNSYVDRMSMSGPARKKTSLRLANPKNQIVHYGSIVIIGMPNIQRMQIQFILVYEKTVNI